MADRTIDAALSAFGRLDVLANVAGIFPTMLIEATTDDAFSEAVETNLGSTFRLCRAAAPHMRGQPGANIVNISSTAARFPTPGLAVYGATKAAVEALTRALAVELAPGVRVNAVSPGPTLTEAVQGLMQSDTTGAVQAVTKALPLQRLGEPEEIAEAVVFLASNRASFITGQVLHANGGGLMA
jgi:NAD(P)-dependent dehydrogenase (short-subunit alcohol dehydrogenase family)